MGHKEDGKIKNRHDLATMRQIMSMVVKASQALAIVALSGTTVYFATTQRIVMQPPFKIDRPMTLDFDQEVDKKTVESMGEVLTSSLKNVTPENVIKQHNKLLPLIPATEYDVVKDKLDADSRSVIRSKLVRVLHIDNTDSSKKGEIRITGIERTSVEGKEISAIPTKLTWFYNFKQTEGFVVLGYKEEQLQ